MSRLFVIVVTFKGGQWYDRCFSSLRESTIPVNVIVVDNASNDRTVGYIRENYPEIHLIESKENLGFGRANNIALRYAIDQGCDYVFLLNQDAWVEKDTFEKMINIHRYHQDYGILGCINVTKDKKHMLKGFIPTIADPNNGNMDLIDDLYFSRLQDIYEIKSILAAAWLLPKQTIEKVGGFDPLFFHYGEDDNYIQRVIFHGMKIGVCPKCSIVHDAQSARVPEAIALRKKEHSQKREWLLRWCDVNSNSDNDRLALKLLLKILKRLVAIDFKNAKMYYVQYRYYVVNKKMIQGSLSTNRIPGLHYL